MHPMEQESDQGMQWAVGPLRVWRLGRSLATDGFKRVLAASEHGISHVKRFLTNESRENFQSTATSSSVPLEPRGMLHRMH
jgi:hypothetical protein